MIMHEIEHHYINCLIYKGKIITTIGFTLRKIEETRRVYYKNNLPEQGSSLEVFRSAQYTDR